MTQYLIPQEAHHLLINYFEKLGPDLYFDGMTALDKFYSFLSNYWLEISILLLVLVFVSCIILVFTNIFPRKYIEGETLYIEEINAKKFGFRTEFYRKVKLKDGEVIRVCLPHSFSDFHKIESVVDARFVSRDKLDNDGKSYLGTDGFTLVKYPELKTIMLQDIFTKHEVAKTFLKTYLESMNNDNNEFWEPDHALLTTT